MSVKAAATMPPVQDSAVARVRPRARQAASTAAARALRSSAKDLSPEGEKGGGIEGRDEVVRHHAEPARQPAVGPARGPWLDDVREAEEREAGGVGERIERRRSAGEPEGQPLSGDLVDDDG